MGRVQKVLEAFGGSAGGWRGWEEGSGCEGRVWGV